MVFVGGGYFERSGLQPACLSVDWPVLAWLAVCPDRRPPLTAFRTPGLSVSLVQRVVEADIEAIANRPPCECLLLPNVITTSSSSFLSSTGLDFTVTDCTG